MSNNLVSHAFTIPNQQMDQLQPMFSSAGSQKLSMSSAKMELSEPMSHTGGAQNLMYNSMAYVEPKTKYLGQHEFVIPNNDVRDMKAMLSNSGAQQLPALMKRKSPMESANSLAPQALVPTRRVGDPEHRPWMNPASALNRNFAQVQSTSIKGASISPTSQQSAVPHKRTTQIQPAPTRLGSQKSSTPKNNSAQTQPSPRARNDMNDSVRSKLRESLSAALALVTEEQARPSNLEEKKAQVEAGAASGQAQENVHLTGTDSNDAVEAQSAVKKAQEASISFGCVSAQTENNGEGASLGGDSATDHHERGQVFQPIVVSPDEDVTFTDNFFVKDDLLQGNGLSWALDFDNWVAEKENQATKKQKVDNKDVPEGVKEKEVETPHNLALKVELELFKLFGGVNKKYKEKGRSLIFNLKDRSNPELRVKVLSGEISPMRLCSMTAEELASKELSEWRIAKAEELAQMVVLPDSDVDMRRLVKKTHKGEFQVVEVEQDDSVSVEVSVGSSSLLQNRSKAIDIQAHSPSKTDSTDISRKMGKSDEQDSECTFTIPSSEGTDLMQGLMVDELKDAEFLPPIVSLDEFMESLDAEPPFEILPVDAEENPVESEKQKSGLESESKSSRHSLGVHVNATPDKNDSVDVPKPDAKAKSSGNKEQSEKADANSSEKKTQSPEVSQPDGKLNGEHAWEGLVQLNLSSTISVTGLFKSGEKTSTKEWPGVLEIKGRVKLDAFEKFLQDLRMSRSRAIMVVHFVQKEGSPKSESSSLREVADAYVSDDRVGYAEPATGVELYLCPPHPKILEKFQKHMATEHAEALNSTIDKGLIGVIVWRKAHVTSTISSNSSSHHHKHSFKKQHHHQNTTLSSGKRHQDKFPIVNPKKQRPMPFNSQPSNPVPSSADDEDDVPPGFGPSVSRDDDDLPEYNFAGGVNPAGNGPFNLPAKTHSRPADQMRELVYKYGQTGNDPTPRILPERRSFVGVQPWDDDDDDIPEWQPEQQLPPPPPPPHASHIPPPLQLHNHQQQLMVNQPNQSLRAAAAAYPPHQMPPMANMVPGQQQNVSWKVPPLGHQNHYYGPPPSSRGF